MSLNVRKLQSLYKSDAVSRAIIDTLREEGASQVPEVTEFGGGYVTVPAFAALPETQRMLAIIKALKAIQKTGCGTFITGRKGDNSRMSWDLEPQEIYSFATGGGEPLVELAVATLPEPAPSRFPNLDACVQPSLLPSRGRRRWLQRREPGSGRTTSRRASGRGASTCSSER